jgi:hypothetical protein
MMHDEDEILRQADAIRAARAGREPPEWEAACLRWRGRILTGKGRHYCPEWDYLPVDETTMEWSTCICGRNAD